MPSASTIRRSRLQLDARALMSLSLALLCMAAGAGLAWSHPISPAIMLAAIIGWTAAVAWRPGVWLFVVPAALPLLNFGPWTGWIVFEEFELLVLGAAAGCYGHLAFLPPGVPAGPAGARSDRKAFIGQIEADCRNLHGGRSFRFEWLLTLPLWHVDAVIGWGRPSHCIRS
jgi:energy-coupling factor transporter transmembrane protein EcfT